MEKKVGNVVLDYSFYNGEDLYSDGDIEDILLEAFRSGEQETLLHNSSQWAVLYHVSDIRENILDWYSFDEASDVLEIGSGCGAITGMLSRKAASVTCVELSEKRSLINAYRNADRDNIRILIGNFQDIRFEKKFDYITLIGVWEYAGSFFSGRHPYVNMLERVKDCLKPGGKIIVAIENKVGLKYWNGAPEDHTEKLYSGLNDYIGEKNVRTFSKPEIEDILKKVGIQKYCFYYPMPDYKLPEYIYSEKNMPAPGKIRCYKENYNASRLYTFYDATSFDQVCRDGMFSYFANSFLFVCGEDQPQVCFAKYNRTRKHEFRTSIRIVEQNGEKFVVKEALDNEAQAYLLQLKENEQLWENMLPGISCVRGEIRGNHYETPYVEGTDLDIVFFELRNDPEAFIKKVKEIFQTYLKPEEKNLLPFEMTKQFQEIFGSVAPSDGKSLKATNIDLNFPNLKLADGKLFNFDFEWVYDFKIPFEYVLWRAADALYQTYAIYLKRYISEKEFLIAVGISGKNLSAYHSMEKNFTQFVLGHQCREDYLKNYKKGAIELASRSL